MLCLLSTLSLLQALYSQISQDSGRAPTVITGNSGVKTCLVNILASPLMKLITKEREEGETSRFCLQRDEKLMRWKDAQGCMRKSCRGKGSHPAVGEGKPMLPAEQKGEEGES